MGDPADGRRARFEALYSAHGRRILGYALRRTSQPADAADVLAEAFLVAWRRLDDVPDGAEAGLWLYAVARRVLANQRRGSRRRAALGERLAGVLAEHVAPDPAEDAGTGAAMRAALAALPESDREVLLLAGWEGLTAPEIAVVIDVPAATVRTRLHRARARLRAAYGDERPLVRDHEDQP
ncbi:MAG TPA: RNA polymerase sigma factor [Acidimicrobiales bacterium]